MYIYKDMYMCVCAPAYVCVCECVSEQYMDIKCKIIYMDIYRHKYIHVHVHRQNCIMDT